jgi:hypothetical protein
MIINPNFLQTWELLSYVVTVLGLPFAIFAIWREMRVERVNEAKEIEQREDEIYVELSQQYSGFLEAVLAAPELDLMSISTEATNLTPAQQQKKFVYYEMLIALFERAYILLFEDGATGNTLRRWLSWEDYIKWWLKKPDFKAYLVDALEGEDPDFAEYVLSLAK